jgi:hypothetical protein
LIRPSQNCCRCSLPTTRKLGFGSLFTLYNNRRNALAIIGVSLLQGQPTRSPDHVFEAHVEWLKQRSAGVAISTVIQISSVTPPLTQQPLYQKSAMLLGSSQDWAVKARVFNDGAFRT